MSKPSDLIQGTLDLLILKTVALEPRHEWAIAKRIQQVGNDVLLITGVALSRAAPAGAAGMAEGAGGQDRDRPRRQVLRPDRGRPPAAGSRARERGPALDGDRSVVRKPSSRIERRILHSEHRMSRTIDKVRLRLASLFRAGNAGSR